MKNSTYNTILELLENVKDEDDARRLITQMRWNGTIICPHCGSDAIYHFSDHKRYVCKACDKQFTVTKGTIFENSKIPLRKWLIALFLSISNKKGITSIQLSKQIGVTQKTAWFMLQRLRQMFEEKAPELLDGVVEVDETYVGGKHKGKRGRGSENKTPVFGMVQRNGNVIAKTVADTKRKTLVPIIEQYIRKGCKVMSDEWWAYRNLKTDYIHKYVKHKTKQYAVGDVHTNTIEGFWSYFKRGTRGVYQYVSRKHMQRYVDEFTFRYNNRKNSIECIFIDTLKNIERRISYKELIVG
jgi:transposase-like protein